MIVMTVFSSSFHELLTAASTRLSATAPSAARVARG